MLVSNIRSNPKAAALISLLLVLPLLTLELLHNTMTRQNAPGLIALFVLLWLLPTAFVMLLTPVLRSVRGGSREGAGSPSLLLRIMVMLLIAVFWVVIVKDQLPCFLGVTNCD